MTSRSLPVPLNCTAARLLFAFLLSLVSESATAQDRERLLSTTAAVRKLSEAEVIALVPKQSGLQYVDCPNCTAGHQERQLTWTLDRPHEVSCKYCGHRYPSEKYPMREAVEVRTPQGNTARFEYWADEKGYRHFFNARRDDEIRRYLSSQTLSVARLYSVTKDPTHARRAAVILDRFAQIYPDWCYHYDYPFQQKEIYDGNVSPAEFRSGFRTARWNWWAYGDIPDDLMEAYRLIRESGAVAELSKEQNVDVAARIENDLLRQAGEQVISNRDDLSNMSPGMWSDVARLGQLLDEPRYVHEVVRRFRQLVSTQFFYDGTWCEGAPSYGQQTVGALQNFADTVKGYSDPAGVIDPVDKARFDNLNLKEEAPQLQRAQYALDRLRYPNGRPVPVHDTWAGDRARRTGLPSSSWLLPALGHGCLRTGDVDNPTEWHLTWSGGYGHSHADVLSLSLFANSSEVLSDLGYSHTAYRAWTIATAAHNTVVIDGKSQASGSKSSPTDGSLRLFDMHDSRVQIVKVDGRRAYPGVVSRYERTLVVIDDGPQGRYALDLFDIDGGKTHDYFLHGDADAPGAVTTALALQDRATLLPEGMEWKAPTHEGQSGRAYQPHDPYGFFQQLKSATVVSPSPLSIEFTAAGKPTLRATFLPEPGSELTLGRNPAIRGAGEDDSQLEKFHRPFAMLRHQAVNGRSRFVTLLEPLGGPPSIRSVRRVDAGPDALAIEVRTGRSAQLIVLNALRPVTFGDQSLTTAPVKFQGEAGVLCVRENKVQYAWSIGAGEWQVGKWKSISPGRISTSLVAIEPDAIVARMPSGDLPTAGDVIELATADGWVYPFNVRSATPAGDDVRIQVVEGLDMQFDAAKETFRLNCFPQRSHRGEVSVEWLPGRIDRPRP